MAGYILGETHEETERLRVQAAHDSVEGRLRWAGALPGMRAVDAGCGPGDVSRALAALVGPSGAVHGYDLSAARIEAARAAAPRPNAAPLTFEVADLHTLPYPDATADLVVCQYVLEYLPDPMLAVNALVRALKPGGILLLMDCDGIGAIQWPVPGIVEDGLPILFRTLAKTGFDPYVGRKLYSFAVQARLRDIHVTTYAPMMAGGAVRPDEQRAWEQRFDTLAPLAVAGFGSPTAWKLFTEAYLAMLRDATSFKFVLGVAVRGVR